MERRASLFIQALIVYSIITLSLETVPDFFRYRPFFRVSEVVVVAIFTVEYFVRWFLAEDRRKYPFRPMAIVDVLAILPFYVQMGIDLRSIRAVRLLRLFRLLKLARYNRAMQTLAEAFKRAGPELAVFLFVVGIVILISSMALYYAEHDAQPQVYSSIPASLWWAVVTLTTVGYGDVYPVTVFGKLIAAVVMLVAIGLIAVPTGILSSHMTDVMRERQKSDSSPATG